MYSNNLLSQTSFKCIVHDVQTLKTLTALLNQSMAAALIELSVLILFHLWLQHVRSACFLVAGSA